MSGSIYLLALVVTPAVGCGGGGSDGSAGAGGIGGEGGSGGFAGVGGAGGAGGAGGVGGEGGSGGSAGVGGSGGAGGIGGFGGSGGAGGSGGVGGAGGAGGAGGMVCQDDVCPCTEAGIRAAITAGGGPYTFGCDGPQTVVTEAEIVIGNDVILDGGGELTLDGGFNHRVLSVAEVASAELRALQVIRGNDSTNRAGGILNEGTLTLTDSLVSMSVGGGLRNLGTAAVTNCTISDNQGGGLRNAFQATMTLEDSTVSGNISDDFGLGGGIWSDGTLLSTGSTVSGNVAGVEGGGIYNSGDLTLINNTVSGNAAGTAGGGIHSDDSTVDVVLINNTVANNSAPDGSAVSSDLSAPLTFRGNVVQGTCGGLGTFTSDGYNVESPGDTCAFTLASDQVGVSGAGLNLGALADNGGPTQTHALDAGSVAIDVIPEMECLDADANPLTVDQRGEPRPGGAMCDVGAFEVQP
jgi:hypothetical protein